MLIAFYLQGSASLLRIIIDSSSFPVIIKAKGMSIIMAIIFGWAAQNSFSILVNPISIYPLILAIG